MIMTPLDLINDIVKIKKLWINKRIIYLEVILLTISVYSCNIGSSNKTSYVKKISLDTAFNSVGERENLRLEDLANIDSINGFRGLKLNSHFREYDWYGVQMDTSKVVQLKRISINDPAVIINNRRIDIIRLLFYRERLTEIKLRIKLEEKDYPFDWVWRGGDTEYNYVFSMDEYVNNLLDDFINIYGKPNVKYTKTGSLYKYHSKSWLEYVKSDEVSSIRWFRILDYPRSVFNQDTLFNMYNTWESSKNRIQLDVEYEQQTFEGTEVSVEIIISYEIIQQNDVINSLLHLLNNELDIINRRNNRRKAFDNI